MLEISPRSGGSLASLREVYRYRELIIVLGKRDLRVRYAQTLAGASWAVIQPLAMLAVFVVVFGKGLKIETGGIPYPVFALTGIVTWTFFAFTLRASSGSIIGSGEMIKKIYFPRLIIPVSKIIVPAVEFGVGLLLIAGILVWYGMGITTTIYLLPLLALLLGVTALGGGLWFSAMSIRYRDFQHVVPFLIQTGLYASPVVYPSSVIPAEWQLVYHLNPMAGVIEGARAALTGGAMPEYFWLSAGTGCLLFVTGGAFFFSVEKKIADYV